MRGARVFVRNNKVKIEGDWWFWDEKGKTLRDRLRRKRESGMMRNSREKEKSGKEARGKKDNGEGRQIDEG